MHYTRFISAAKKMEMKSRHWNGWDCDKQVSDGSGTRGNVDPSHHRVMGSSEKRGLKQIWGIAKRDAVGRLSPIIFVWDVPEGHYGGSTHTSESSGHWLALRDRPLLWGIVPTVDNYNSLIKKHMGTHQEKSPLECSGTGSSWGPLVPNGGWFKILWDILRIHDHVLPEIF